MVLPKCFPAFTTVQYCFYLLLNSGVLNLLNEALVCFARRLCGRDENPTPLSMIVRASRRQKRSDHGASTPAISSRAEIGTSLPVRKVTCSRVLCTKQPFRTGTERPELSTSHAQACPAWLIFLQIAFTQVRSRKKN